MKGKQSSRLWDRWHHSFKLNICGPDTAPCSLKIGTVGRQPVMYIYSLLLKANPSFGLFVCSFRSLSEQLSHLRNRGSVAFKCAEVRSERVEIGRDAVKWNISDSLGLDWKLAVPNQRYSLKQQADVRMQTAVQRNNYSTVIKAEDFTVLSYLQAFKAGVHRVQNHQSTIKCTYKTFLVCFETAFTCTALKFKELLVDATWMLH